MLRLLGAIIPAVLGVLGFVFGTLGKSFNGVMQALGYWPSVPPASDNGKLEGFASEDEALCAIEDLNLARDWACAKLFGKDFTHPASRIGEWLSELNVDDAARIAKANSNGTLGEHIAGRTLVSGLPPVADAEQTQGWCATHRPAPARHEPRSRAQRVVSTETDDVEDHFSMSPT